MEVNISVKNIDKVMKNLSNLQKDLEKPFREVIKGGAQEIRKEAVKSIQTGSKTGRIYEKYNPRRTHRASAPGESPASDTGNLVRNIRVIDKGQDEVIVKSNAPYSAYLEYGTSKMLARPFLFPAYEKSKKKIIKATFNRVVKAIEEITK